MSYWYWLGPALVVLTAGLYCLFALEWGRGGELLDQILFGLVYGVAVITGLFVVWALQRWRELGHARSAKSLGLTCWRCVSEGDIRPYASHLLFATTAGCQRWAGYWMEGRFGETGVAVFVYRFAGRLRLPSGKQVPWVGWHSVLVIPGLTGVPDFLLCPEEGDYELADTVEGSLRVVERDEALLEVDDGGGKLVLRGPDGARLRRLFGRSQRVEMGRLDGWTIECLGGKLVLFREGEVFRGEALGHFLQHGTRIASALRVAVAAPG